MSVDLLITGTGSLAQATLFDLMTITVAPLKIMLAGRHQKRLEWLVLGANARAHALGTQHRTESRLIDWDKADDLARLLNESAPQAVFHAASLQSAWDLRDTNNAWSSAVGARGYGITLPLQLFLAIRLARAMQEHTPTCRLVNACYPDVSNEILRRLGYEVLCGVGNVATLASACAARVTLRDDGQLKMFAHHRQIALATDGCMKASPPRLWVSDVELTPDAMPDIQLPRDASLNLVTGACTARLLIAVLDRVERYVGHAPGPFGLPGGYPITVAGGTLQLRLPNGVELAEAVSWNRASANEEGLTLDANGFIHVASSAVTRYATGSSLPSSYHIDDVEAVAEDMLQLKEVMRHQAA